MRILNLLFKCIGSYYSFVGACRNRRDDRRYRTVHKKLVQYFNALNGLKVCDGIFEGLQYVNPELKGRVPSAFVPKLIGSYEDELTLVMEEIFRTGYSEIIDVGCAEGYYAVGFALRIPEVIVYAFDINCDARVLCSEMAFANGVGDRVVVGEMCFSETLNEIKIRRKALVMCDCEGYELDLLDTAKLSNYNQLDFLVELHDFIKPEISREIIGRFSETHTIQIIKSVARKNPAHYTILKGFKEYDKYIALAEHRPCIMEWAYLKARISKS